MVDARSGLDDCIAREQFGDEVPRWLPVVWGKRASPRRTTSRVGEGDIKGVEVDGGRIGDHGGATDPCGREIGLRHLDAEWVEVDARCCEACQRKCDQVTADAATQIDDGLQSSGLHPGCSMATHAEAGGLLQGVVGEVHPRGEVSKLPLRLGA